VEAQNIKTLHSARDKAIIVTPLFTARKSLTAFTSFSSWVPSSAIFAISSQLVELSE
jgi:hypothetical protein